MANEFENKVIRGIHVSRYIASWRKATWETEAIERQSDFPKWLSHLIIDGEPLLPEEIRFIRNFAENGKMELEQNAKDYLDAHG